MKDYQKPDAELVEFESEDISLQEKTSGQGPNGI